MLRELISASLTQKNTEQLERLPKRLLEKKDLEVVDWIINYSKDHKQTPEIERFKQEGDYDIYWTESLNVTPLEDLYEQTVTKLNFDACSKAFAEINENYYESNKFDYKQAKELMKQLTPSNGTRHKAESIFSDSLDDMFNGNNSMRLPFGIPSLDEAVGGIKVGDYAQVLAPTSVGKTMFLCFLAIRAARGGNKVLFISREVTRSQLKEKMSAIVGNFNNKLFESIDKDDRLKLKLKKEVVQRQFQSIKNNDGGEIKIPSASAFSVSDIEGLVREETRKTGKGYDLVIVDNIYDLSQESGSFAGGDWVAMRSISIDLRDLAKDPELQMRLIVSSQIKPERKEESSFTINDIAYCKAIAQDADTVFTIGNIYAGKLNLGIGQQLLLFKLMKNRNGPMSWYDSEMVIDYNYSSISVSNGYSSIGDDLSKEPLKVKEVKSEQVCSNGGDSGVGTSTP